MTRPRSQGTSRVVYPEIGSVAVAVIAREECRGCFRPGQAVGVFMKALMRAGRSCAAGSSLHIVENQKQASGLRAAVSQRTAELQHRGAQEEEEGEEDAGTTAVAAAAAGCAAAAGSGAAAGAAGQPPWDGEPSLPLPHPGCQPGPPAALHHLAQVSPGRGWARAARGGNGGRGDGGRR